VERSISDIEYSIWDPPKYVTFPKFGMKWYWKDPTLNELSSIDEA